HYVSSVSSPASNGGTLMNKLASGFLTAHSSRPLAGKTIAFRFVIRPPISFLHADQERSPTGLSFLSNRAAIRRPHRTACLPCNASANYLRRGRERSS